MSSVEDRIFAEILVLAQLYRRPVLEDWTPQPQVDACQTKPNRDALCALRGPKLHPDGIVKRVREWGKADEYLCKCTTLRLRPVVFERLPFSAVLWLAEGGHSRPSSGPWGVRHGGWSGPAVAPQAQGQLSRPIFSVCVAIAAAYRAAMVMRIGMAFCWDIGVGRRSKNGGPGEDMSRR